MISKSVSFSEELDGLLIFRCVWLCNNHFNLNTSVRPPNLKIFIGCELSVCMGVCDFIAESTNDVLKRIKKCVCWNTLQFCLENYSCALKKERHNFCEKVTDDRFSRDLSSLGKRIINWF